MKVHYEKVTTKTNESFVCFEAHDYSNVAYHHHEEIEITYIYKGDGQRCVGHQIKPFQHNELVILGPMLPHTWQPSQKCIDHNEQHSFVLLFSPTTFGTDLWNSPEFSELRKFLAKASSGIQTTPKDTNKIISLFRKIIHTTGIERVIAFMDLLNDLTHQSWSEGISPLSNTTKNEAPIIEKVIAYMLQHYPEEIRQPDLAKLSCMSHSHFSRFFKKSTGFSFSNYLNRVRVTQACQLLSNSDKSIAHIAFDVGYKNLSQFNLSFKKLCEITPKEYRNKSLKT